MQFYHDIITQKSFLYLQGLKKRHDFILIGGWAVFLYTRSLKSKDIDIIVDYNELAKMKEEHNVFKNERLKKYEIKTGEFDIDIYLDHYFRLGIDIAEIKKNTQNKDGFNAPWPEILLLLKLFAWENRRGSAKGQKDELDIFSLVALPEFDWEEMASFARQFKFQKYSLEFKLLLKKTARVKELGLNEQQFSKLKKKILPKLDF